MTHCCCHQSLSVVIAVVVQICHYRCCSSKPFVVITINKKRARVQHASPNVVMCASSNSHFGKFKHFIDVFLASCLPHHQTTMVTTSLGRIGWRMSPRNFLFFYFYCNLMYLLILSLVSRFDNYYNDIIASWMTTGITGWQSRLPPQTKQNNNRVMRWQETGRQWGGTTCAQDMSFDMSWGWYVFSNILLLTIFFKTIIAEDDNEWHLPPCWCCQHPSLAWNARWRGFSFHPISLTQGKQGPNDDRCCLGPGKLFHLSKYLLITFFICF